MSGSEFPICEVATGKFEIRYFQVIGAGRAECSSTRYVSDTSEWSQVSRRGIVKDFIAQYCSLILYALRDPQPVKADECVCDVVGAFQIEDHVAGFKSAVGQDKHQRRPTVVSQRNGHQHSS